VCARKCSLAAVAAGCSATTVRAAHSAKVEPFRRPPREASLARRRDSRSALHSAGARAVHSHQFARPRLVFSVSVTVAARGSGLEPTTATRAVRVRSRRPNSGLSWSSLLAGSHHHHHHHRHHRHHRQQRQQQQQRWDRLAGRSLRSSSSSPQGVRAAAVAVPLGPAAAHKSASGGWSSFSFRCRELRRRASSWGVEQRETGTESLVGGF
jgi:hypothetical protein